MLGKGYTFTLSNSLYGYSESKSMTTNLTYNVTAGAYSYSIYDGATLLIADTVVIGAGSTTEDLSFIGNNSVYLYDIDSSSYVANANITVTYPNSNTLDLTTDTNGLITFPDYNNFTLQEGNYTIYVNNIAGYVTPITFTKSATESSLPFNQTYNISQTNLNVSIYYRLNGTAFTENANIIIQGVLNATTSTGNYNINNLTISSGTYTIQVLSDGYYTEQRVFTFDDQEDLDLSFYMLKVNETNSQTLTIRALDIAQRLVSGATIDLLEYDSSTLSYIEVSECTTNEEGECEFLIELGTKTYKWQGTKTEGGDLLFGETQVGETFQASIVSGEEVVFSELSRDLILRVSTTFNFGTFLNYLYYDITESF